MPARLILNADDFGLTPGINRAIGELHSAGVLPSATLMANGPAFDDAVAIARAHPSLGVGCHIVLTDGVPVAEPSRIPSLIGSDGRSFRPSMAQFIRDLFLGRIHADDVAREARAQINKLQHVGIPITHIDTHKHTHLFPSIARSLLHVADSSQHPRHPQSIRAAVVRRAQPRQPRCAAPASGSSARCAPASRTRSRSAKKVMLTTDGTLGISATGQLTPTTLTELLRALPPTGTYELCCHPGYNDADLDRVATRLRAQRELEREALLSEIPKALARADAPLLVHYGSLAA